MKKILVLFFCLLLGGSVGAESIKDAKSLNSPLKNKKVFNEVNEENFPVMFKYFRDYAESFLYKYDITKDPPPGFVNFDKFYIHKDGTVAFPYKYDTSKHKDWNNFRQFIKNNPPPPFPEGIEDEAILVDLSIENDMYREGNRITLLALNPGNLYRGYGVRLNIHIFKNKENMHMSKRKCKKLGCEWDEEGGFCRLKYRVSLDYFDD